MHFAMVKKTGKHGHIHVDIEVSSCIVVFLALGYIYLVFVL